MSAINDLIMQLNVLDDPRDIGELLNVWMDIITNDNFEKLIPFLNQKTVTFAGYMDLFRKWQEWCKSVEPKIVLKYIDSSTLPMGWVAWAQKFFNLDNAHRDTINSMLQKARKSLPEKVNEYEELVKKPKTWLN